MAVLKSTTSPLAVVIGDIVRSRRAPRRQALHDRLVEVLADVAGRTDPVDPFWVTVGDEFQGAYAHLGQAIEAAFRVRLALLPGVDARFGIGWGEVSRLDVRTQDGPGWWAARDAIEWVKGAESRTGTRSARTAFRSADPRAPSPDAVNAALLCRDHLVGSWDERSVRVMRGLMSGDTQVDLARAEGISASAVSQRVRAAGLGAVHTSMGWLAELP